MRIERDQIRTIAVVAALTAVFVGALWLPHKFREQKLQERIEHAKAQLATDGAAAQALPTLAKEVADLRREATHSRKTIPHGDDLADLLHQLSSDLQTQQAADQEIQTQGVTSGSDFSVIPISLAFKSSCPAAFDFVKKVESSKRLVRITRFQLMNDLSKPAEPLKVHIELCTFFSATEGKGQ